MNATNYMPARRRVGRGRRQGVASSPAPAALTLMSATYLSGSSVTLTFNQPIDTSALEPGDFVVSDGSGTGYIWVGRGGTQPSANVVVIELELFESASAGPVLLTVNGSNGIVAASDDEPWAGVVDLPLPYSAG
jgi:hypothetical protein